MKKIIILFLASIIILNCVTTDKSSSGAGLCSPLVNAVKEGNVEEVKKLIKEGANVNETYKEPVMYTDGTFALHMAVARSNKEIVILLLENKADPNLNFNEDKSSPLFRAFISGYIDIAKILIENDADPNLISKNGDTPLNKLLNNSKIKIDDKLMILNLCKNKGHNFNDNLLFSVREYEIVKYLVKNGKNINIKDEEGLIPLHYYVRYARLGAVKAAIEIGANLNAKDKGGYTPLHYVRLGGGPLIENGNLVIEDENNVKMNYKSDQPYYDPEYLAEIKKNRVEIANLLIKNRANVNIVDNEGRTPLHIIALGNNLTIAEILLKAGAKINIKNNYGRTPLDYAVISNNDEIKELFGRYK